MNWLILSLMIAVLGWNAYGIYEVGTDQASKMQWFVTIAMLVFVVFRFIRMMVGDRDNWPESE